MAEKVLDITNLVCPVTWVKTKLALEALQPGEALRVAINRGEALENVPRSAREEGHLVVEATGEGGRPPGRPVTIRIVKDGLRLASAAARPGEGRRRPRP